MRPAVVVATKMGLLFVLDRDTGKPLFDVEERPVPPSDVPGEAASPTQPFPALPAPLGPSSLTPEQVWGATPEQRRECQAALAAMSAHGLYTPPSTTGTLVWPGNAGGVAWGGVAVDPERHLLVVNSNRLATLVQLIPREQYPAARAGNRFGGEFAPQLGTPFGVYRRTWVSAAQLPCTPLPWGVLTAIDLDAGKQLWQVPLGDARELPQGASLPPGPATGLPSLGGALVTASGLVFIAAAMDTYLRAFDSNNGRELWKARLPASAQATPMTYVLDGRQYVVIAAGGHGKLGTKQGDAVVAFALPPGR
jgi:quinoprotein glucose dehydrogenase